MKKSISLLSILLILFFTDFKTSTFEIPATQAGPFSQGFYTLKDLNLAPDIKYTVQNE